MSTEKRQLALGVIGCGHWGPNHVRVFSETDRARVVACADVNPGKLERVRRRFPKISATTNYQDLLIDQAVDAVVIATPTNTHAKIAQEALQSGKHVLVEKPLCTTSDEAVQLARLAASSERVLMVGHVFLFNNGIMKLRESIRSGALGRIHYLDAVRTNLGPVRGDVNALFDLGTHDISIFNYLMDAVPVEVSAQGRCISQPGIEDVCFATLRYPDGTLGHIHVSWMNPRKVRTLTVIGERQMAHWDDVEPADTLRLYDQGLNEPPNYDSYGEFHCLLRSGDVHLPAIRRTEPLLNQAEAFLDWVLEGQAQRSGATDSLNVVKVLEAAMQSIKQGGASIAIDAPSTVCEKTSSRQDKVLQRPKEWSLGEPFDPGVADSLVQPARSVASTG